MVILACISLLVPAVKHPDYMAVFAVIMVLMTASALILFFTVKEPEAVDVYKRQPYWKYSAIISSTPW